MPETVWLLRVREPGWVAGRALVLGVFASAEAAMRTVPVDLDTVAHHERELEIDPERVTFADVFGREHDLVEWEVRT